MQLGWKQFGKDSIDQALAQSFCLYVFHHPDHGDRPFYIGKARYFGTNQRDGYRRSARYNGGYVHLLDGMLTSGFSLYILPIGESAFPDAEGFEQTLIEAWKPIRPQRTTKARKAIDLTKPWNRVSQ